MAIDVAHLQVRVDSQGVATLNQRMAATQAQANSLQGQFKSFGRTTRQLGRTLSMFVTLPVAATFAGATFAAGQFEEAMIEVQKVTDETTAGRLSGEIREMAKTIPLTQRELANLTAQAARFGVRGVDNITAFTEAVAKISIATDLTAERAGEDFARIAELMGVPIPEIENLGSAINELSNNMATSASEIVDSMLRGGAAASTFGLSATQVAGVSASLNEVSESAERAGTRLRRVFQQLTSPRKVAEVANVLGITAERFRELQEANPERLFLGIVRAMSEGGEAARQFRDIFDTSSRQALEGLSKNVEGLAEALGMSDDAYRKNISLQDEFEDAASTLFAQVKILRNEIIEMGIEIGEILMPHVKELVASLKEATGWFTSLSEETQATLIKVAGISAIVGPGLIALGMLSASISSIIGLFGTLSATVIPAVVSGFGTIKVAALIASTEGISALIGSLTILEGLLLATGIGAVVAIISAIGYASYKSYKEISRLNEEADKLIEKDVNTNSWMELEERINRINSKLKELNRPNKSGTGFDGAGFFPKRQELRKELEEAQRELERVRPVGVLNTPGAFFDTALNNMMPRDPIIPDEPLIFRPKVQVDSEYVRESMTEEMRSILDGMNEEIALIGEMVQFPELFPDLDPAEEEINAIVSAIRELLQLDGIDHQSEQVQRLYERALEAQREMNKLNGEIERITDIPDVRIGGDIQAFDQELMDSIDRQIQDVDELARLYRDVGMEFDATGRKATVFMSALEELAQEGKRNTLEYQALVKRLKDMGVEVDKISEKTSKATDFAEEFGLTFSSALEDAIVRFDDLGTVVTAFFEDLLRITTRMTITKPIGNFLSSFIGSAIGGGAGGVDSSVLDGSIPKVTNITDALVTKDGNIIRGHPNDNWLAFQGDSDRLGGGNNVNVNVINQNGSNVETRQRKNAGGGIDIDVLIKNKVREGFQQGAFDSEMALFGNKRQGV